MKPIVGDLRQLLSWLALAGDRLWLALRLWLEGRGQLHRLWQQMLQSASALALPAVIAALG
jgi:hypothetical protein